MFKDKLIKKLIYLVTIGMVAGMNWAVAKDATKGTGTIGVKKSQKGEQIEEYIPKVIINLKWEKTEEKLVPHEGDPWGGWISCGKRIYGRFGKGTVSFGSYDYSIVPSLVIPRSICLDKEENLYILDPANFRVLKFDRDGNYLLTINLQRALPEGCWLGEKERIYVDRDGYIYLINVRDAKLNLKTLKFSKTGRFIETERPSFTFKKKDYTFISNIQDSKKGVVQVIDKEKNIKLLEISINLPTQLDSQGYELEDIEVIGEDKEKNLYVKIVAHLCIEKPKVKLYNKELVYKYSPQGKLLFMFPEKENHTYDDEITSTTVVTEQGIIYDMVVTWEKEQEKKCLTYKLSPSDKMLREIEGIDEFLKQREKCEEKTEKITVKVWTDGFKLPRELKVIKWKKK